MENRIEQTKRKQMVKYILCVVLAIFALITTALSGAWLFDSKTGDNPKDVNFGKVEISLGSGTKVTALDSNAKTITRSVLPGDTVRVTLQVAKGTDSEEFYWKAKTILTMSGTGEVIDNGWTAETYNTKEDTSAINIDIELDLIDFDNNYEKQNITVSYEVRAIQMANLTEEQASFAINTTNQTNWESGNISIETSEGLVYQLCSKQDLLGDGNLYYVPDENGTEMFLTSIGTCTDTDIFVKSEHNGYPVVGVVGTIDMSTYMVNNIAGPAVNLADNSYTYNTTITSVTLPRSIKYIDAFAFGAMSSVNVNISELSNLEFIGESAFFGCSSLNTVTFEEGSQLQSIGAGAFNNCTALKSIEIPRGVTSIGNYSFDGCSSLNTVTFEEGSQLQSIGAGAFGNCTALKSIEIPRGVTSIETSAFYGCSALNTVTFEEGSQLQSLGADVFYHCSALESIEIPYMVTSIGTSAFAVCNALKTITFAEDSQLKSIGNYAFNFNSIAFTSITIPSGVTSIGTGAFYGCFALKTITFAEDSQLQNIDNLAFAGCSALEIVYYGGTESDWSAIIIGSDNTDLTNAIRYYYSETQPTVEGNYWHYVNGVPTAW